MKSSPSKSYHAFSTIVETNTTCFMYFKIPVSGDASEWESLPSKTGDKAWTWIKGLKKLSNNSVLPDRATFGSTISMCLRQSQRSWVRIPLSHLNFSGSWDSCLNCPASARIISSVDFKHRTSYNTSFILHSFHGKTWAQQIDLLSTVWLHSSVG